jgi:EAL and modified HD-GYP domain-containing signal transduction protein
VVHDHLTTAPTPTKAEGGTPRSTVHRDPIVTIDGRVLGYTVTIRLEQDPDATPLPPRAHEAILHEQHLALDLASLVADRDLHVSAVGPMLDGFVPTPPSGGRLVVDLPPGFELLADAEPRATALHSLGVGLDLPGFAATPMQVRLLPHLHSVTIDPVTLEQPLGDVVEVAHAAGVAVLAVGVVDVDVLEACLAAGVDALRGSVAERARAVAEKVGPKVLRPGQLQCLVALHLLHQDHVDLGEVADLIDTDPVMTLRVLHLVNSGAFSLFSRVDTVHRAVVLLGIREVTALIAALAIDSRPGAMDSLWLILARALACESLADDAAAYTVGMLSALIDELGVPADVVLEKVGVSDVVSDAVRELAGDLGPVLTAVLAHEAGDTARISAAGFDPADVSDVYLTCLADALETAKAVEG